MFYINLTSRDVPSFPTRRSSDLERKQDVAVDTVIALDAAEQRRVLARRLFAGDHAPVGHSAVQILPSLFAEFWVIALQSEYRDRKSTRLNSSHIVISYAVFCLKK